MEETLLLANGRDQVHLYETSRCNGKEKSYKVCLTYKADGTEISRNKTYKAIINDFLQYGGGDNYSVFTIQKSIGYDNPDTEDTISHRRCE